eukprot:COSAG04_NODE_5014_length_1781_cov_1.618906_1_plen_575_part_10
MFGSAAVLVEESMRQGRSVFGRRTAFAEKLGLPLDAVEPEEGLLSSGPQGWEELGLRPRTVGAVTEPYVVAADALRVAARSGVVTKVGADIALEGAFFRDQEPAATDGEVSEWHGEKARARCAALLRAAAALGSCRAMHRFGSLVLTGELASLRSDKSALAAVELLEFAGRGGCGDALALAGHALAAGMGGAPAGTSGHQLAQHRAAQLYVSAALLGSLDAHAALGRRYLVGEVGTPGAHRPLWREEGALQAAVAVSHYAQAARVAVSQVDGGSSLPYVEWVRVSEAQATAGQDGDEDEMLQYIRLQAEGGDARAMMQMGRLAYAGQRGIARDPAAALDYFERAAEQGNVEAEFNLGVLESRGEGAAGAPDQVAARGHFENAAHGGHIPAQNGLGVMYLQGQGNVTRNQSKAREYFQMAAESGDGDGMANLASLLGSGVGIAAADRQEAAMEGYAWAREAAAVGHTKGTLLLADFTRDGVGTEARAEEAAWLYRRVAERAPALGLVLRQALEWHLLSAGPSEGEAREHFENAAHGDGAFARSVVLYRLGAEVGHAVRLSDFQRLCSPLNRLSRDC